MQELAARLARAIPPVHPFAVALATLIIMVGMAPQIYNLLEQIEFGDLLSRVRALLDLKSQVSVLISQPLAQESLRAQGVSPQILYTQAADAIQGSIDANLPPYSAPSTQSLDSLEEWYTEEGRLWTAGLIDRARIEQAYTDYTAQRQVILNLQAAYARAFGQVVGQDPTAAAPPVAVVTPAPVVTPPPVVTQAPVVGPAAGFTVNVAAPMVNVAAPMVNVAAPSVLIQAPPAPSVRIENLVDVAPIGAAMAGVIPLVGTAVVGALATQMQNMGHLWNQGRAQCFGGTAGALMNLLLPTALGYFSMRTLQSEEGIGGFVSQQAEKWFKGALDPARFPHPATPDTVFATATDRLKEAMSFGLQAHMWSILGESNYVLKNLGLPQVAGLMAEMAGFSRLANAVLGTVEQASLVRPMGYLANRIYRPSVPDASRALSLYSQRELAWEGDTAAPGAHQVIAYHGLSEDWATIMRDDAYRHPSLRELLRNQQYANPAWDPGLASPPADIAAYLAGTELAPQSLGGSDWLYGLAMCKQGYHPAYIPWMMTVARRSLAKPERSAYIGAIGPMVREGFMPLDEARKRIRASWEFEDPIESRLQVMELQRDYRIRSDTRAVTVLSMAKGLITRDEARKELARLDLDSQRIELEVLKGTLGMLPGMRIEISRPEAVLEEAGVEME